MTLAEAVRRIVAARAETPAGRFLLRRGGWPPYNYLGVNRDHFVQVRWPELLQVGVVPLYSFTPEDIVADDWAWQTT